MKARDSLIFLLPLAALVIANCRHEPEKMIITGNPCHPDTVYFERDLLPVLRSNCAMEGCHDAATALDGVILDNFANVMATADVKPGDPDDSDLYEVLIEDNINKRMPLGLPPLNTDQITLVRKWIQQGALNLNCDE